MGNELLLIQQMLNTERDCIKVNKKMIEKLGIESAIIYSYLVNNQLNNLGDDVFLPYTIEALQKATTLSAFKQRNALDELQAQGLIKIKVGQSKLRLISVVEDSELVKDLLFDINLSEHFNKRETIQYLLKQIKIFQDVTKKNISTDVYVDLFKVIRAEVKQQGNSSALLK